jgi:hypothetical protein
VAPATAQSIVVCVKQGATTIRRRRAGLTTTGRGCSALKAPSTLWVCHFALDASATSCLAIECCCHFPVVFRRLMLERTAGRYSACGVHFNTRIRSYRERYDYMQVALASLVYFAIATYDGCLFFVHRSKHCYPWKWRGCITPEGSSITPAPPG